MERTPSPPRPPAAAQLPRLLAAFGLPAIPQKLLSDTFQAIVKEAWTWYTL